MRMGSDYKRAYFRLYRLENLDRLNKYRKQNREDNRLKLLSIIVGGAKICCEMCGYDDVRALIKDHKKGGGNAQRKRFGGFENEVSYYLKHHEEARRVFRILCCNCNIIKARENSEFGNREFLNPLNLQPMVIK